ncbi:hypothetical protein ACN28G_19725 [Micromonospora sp. WMMA1923]|uniref:hypothetical protein n=1 Tax=Micromonospora sp. WMMA1923 TaxID=3404125 RepID=UPI003B92B4C0
MDRFVRGALVDGVSAHLLDRLLADARNVRLLAGLPSWMAVEFAPVREAIGRAAAEYLARAVAVAGSAETVEPVGVAASSPDDLLTCAQAAVLLGVSERRVRQLAARGLGSKHAGRWWLSGPLVETLREERRGCG